LSILIPQTPGCFPDDGGNVTTTTTLLAIDDLSMPLRRNLCLYMSKPSVRREPVLTPEHGDPDAPDNAAAHFYGGVVYERGKYRMWYYACHWGNAQNPLNPFEGNLVEGPTCYAESSDGISWAKPHLEQVEWRGNRRNNIIRLAETFTEGVHVIKDTKDVDTSRRYKMLYNYRPKNRNFWTIRTSTSADGLVWKDGPELPFDGFLEQASLYEFNGLYFANGQMCLRSEGGAESGRQGYIITSPDFVNWLQEYGESFLLPEPAKPDERGAAKPYDQVHIGVGASSFGNVLVGLYCIWHNHPFPTKDDWFGLGTTSGDFGLLVSNDGFRFREPVKGRVFMHRDESPAVLQKQFPHERVLCQGNGILNVGDETRIYHGRWVNSADIRNYHAEVALATLPRDRWGALGLFPQATEGSVWTLPVKLPTGGCELALNADGADSFAVDAAGERFDLIPEFSGSRAGTVSGRSNLDLAVRWPDKILRNLGGRTVRFRIRIQKRGAAEPRLYAAYVR